MLLALSFLLATLLATARVAAADTTEPPNGMIVMLRVRLPAVTATCTGFMVGPHTVATVAHCLYNPELGGWATGATVTPGVDGLAAPYASQQATTFAVSPAWIETRDLATDYAAITLESDALGTATGWFALATATDDDLGSGAFTTAGYGSGEGYGRLWRMPGARPLAAFDDDLVTYRWGTSTGESGAPIFDALPEGGYRAIGLVKGAFTNPGERLEFGVRMSAPVVAFYRAQIARPAAPAEAPPIPTTFTARPGEPVQVTSGVTLASRAAAIQSSVDRVRWTTLATGTTDTRGIATFTISSFATRFYRVVVDGTDLGPVGRGIISGGTGGTGLDERRPGTFASTPRYSARGDALAVFEGGSISQLEGALASAGADAAWVQDPRAGWLLYVVGGTFVNADFNRVFPNGFAAATPMSLVQ